MSGDPLEFRPTIDRGWLESAIRTEPMSHAFALWDLERMPQLVRFRSALEQGRTVAYTMVWLGTPGAPVVHWVGDPDRAVELLASFPPPPFTALVPLPAEPHVRSRYPEAQLRPVLAMVRDRGTRGLPDTGPGIRRLGANDRTMLLEWCLRGAADGRPDFTTLELPEEPVWGAFEDDRLVGVTRAAVRLPAVWVVSGVFVDAAARGRGLGRRLVAAMIAEAERAGAPCGLFVREEATPARAVYAALGFRTVARRWLVETPPSSPSGQRRETLAEATGR